MVRDQELFKADINLDGKIGEQDKTALIGALNSASQDEKFDMNGDGEVTNADLQQLDFIVRFIDPSEFDRADLTNDGSITQEDVNLWEQLQVDSSEDGNTWP